MIYRTLIETAALAERLADPTLLVVDCRFELANTSAGERAYQTAHIPGAVYAHLDRDLSGAKTGRTGRHPLPAPGDLALTFGRWGISPETQVVCYDQDVGSWASRLWWLLRWLGHDAVAVLNGGWAAWAAEGRPQTSAVQTRPPTTFVAAPRPDMVVDARQIPGLTATGVLLVDARAPERYRGDVEPLDPVGGHIPGAVNHFFHWNLADGRFQSPEATRARVCQSIGAVDAQNLVCYCGSGVTACHNLLALEHAGMTGARLYPGSWSEWSSDPGRPVERG